ncbi:Phosphotyrosyl phosphatase activator [Artomyces pyxidatus]|uniref:Phosphotyrosyl phosphatase activator n=1 Tax=Artomyces pyxidatus TaxID=48021 RepID=A0ACB8TKL1_9AGAM|nr:Phosphotyrosyl phosphatase activator [Artomyces pyxidatus]
MSNALFALRHISIEDVSHMRTLPSTKIHTDSDVELWKRTSGYRDYGIFLRRLNEAVVGYELPWTSSSPSEAAKAVLSMLEELDRWTDDIPPLPTPQRFGNLAFRQWGKRLEERADDLLASLLPQSYRAAIPHLKPYFMTSFGSFVRMDYGTGHETSFALFLLCLTLIRFLQPEPEEERHIVLDIFMRYLKLCWKLQDFYNLEPAGSHGVWGLDDSHFLGYMFGSAQLKGQSDIPVDSVLRPPLPPTNLYFMSIMRIHAVKTGPFHEHSSQLYSIATGVAKWSKVNSGLFKMYEAEVLGKRVVVQHIPLGGLLEWDVPSSGAQSPATRFPSSPQQPTNAPSAPGGTQAPWAAGRAPTRSAASSWGTTMRSPPGGGG